MSGNYAIEWGQDGTTARVEAPTRGEVMKMYDEVAGAKTCSCGPNGACDRCGGRDARQAAFALRNSIHRDLNDERGL